VEGGSERGLEPPGTHDGEIRFRIEIPRNRSRNLGKNARTQVWNTVLKREVAVIGRMWVLAIDDPRTSWDFQVINGSSQNYIQTNINKSEILRHIIVSVSRMRIWLIGPVFE
jgi:hypothetical protein